jgi:hypothetical protein
MNVLSSKSNYNTLLGEFEEAVSTTQVLSGCLFAFVAKIW